MRRGAGARDGAVQAFFSPTMSLRNLSMTMRHRGRGNQSRAEVDHCGGRVLAGTANQTEVVRRERRRKDGNCYSSHHHSPPTAKFRLVESRQNL